MLGTIAPEMLRNEAVFPKGGYQLHVEPPKKMMNKEDLKKRAWKLAVLAYEEAFHVSIHHTSRTENVLVLQIRKPGLCNVEKAKEADFLGGGTSSHGYRFRKNNRLLIFSI